MMYISICSTVDILTFDWVVEKLKQRNNKWDEFVALAFRGGMFAIFQWLIGARECVICHIGNSFMQNAISDRYFSHRVLTAHTNTCVCDEIEHTAGLDLYIHIQIEAHKHT